MSRRTARAALTAIAVLPPLAACTPAGAAGARALTGDAGAVRIERLP